VVKVKVCGITNLDDALEAVELGADALGFNFYPPSPRFISPEAAGRILGELPPTILKVALFVNESRATIEGVVSRAARGGEAFGALQFHGDESAGDCLGWSLKIIKAFRIKEKASLEALEGFPADFYLLDSYWPGYGGSGAPFPWSWLEGVATERLILAGGLNAENVAEAIRRVRPYGVDVCTGVERSPGVKDHEKLKRFIEAAKAA
jgi:phosphoribosylanthranilate isomerase